VLAIQDSGRWANILICRAPPLTPGCLHVESSLVHASWRCHHGGRHGAELARMDSLSPTGGIRTTLRLRQYRGRGIAPAKDCDEFDFCAVSQMACCSMVRHILDALADTVYEQTLCFSLSFVSYFVATTIVRITRIQVNGPVSIQSKCAVENATAPLSIG